MSRPNAFSALLRRQSTAEQREYLNQVRSELRLAEDDALWALVLVVQDFCDELRIERTEARAPGVSRAPGFVPWTWIGFGAALQTLLSGLAMYVGALAASASAPPWMTGAMHDTHGVEHLLGGALGAPAGWLALVFAMPLALHGVVTGRSLLRTGEPALGRSVIVVSLTAAAACAAAVWWLL